MDSSGWTNIEEEDEFDDIFDPTRITTIEEIRTRRLLAQEIARGKVEERGENTFGWGLLPDVVIEQIYSHLSIRDRYSASLVCQQWFRAFNMQKTWNTFVLQDDTLSRRKYNYYSGWQYRLDHLRTQLCIFRVGKFIRKLVLLPVWNLFNVYEFMSLLSYYSERFEEDQVTPCLLKVYSFRFIFWCNMTTRQEQLVYGTGGEMLGSLKRLMTNLKHLKNLELIDLLLDPREAMHLLDEVCVTLTDKILSLTLINATKDHYNLLHPGVFINLRVLKISPQNLCAEVIEMLCCNNSLEQLYIIQNSYTEIAFPVDSKAWENVGKTFNVFLRTLGKIDKEIIWQEKAPVISILYDSPKTKVKWDSVLTTIEFYNYTLKEYGHLGLPRFTGSRKFSERADAAILTLCRKCPYITTLFVRERISTSTAMLIAGMSPNLKYFYVRSNALIKKCDFDFHNMDLDNNFMMWVKLHCRDYDKMSGEISKILGYDWKPLSDNQYRCISNNRSAY